MPAVQSSETLKATRPTNLSLDAALVAEAKALGVSLSRAANSGLEEAVREARKARWQAENRGAIDAYNTYVAEHGLPLSAHRPF